MNNLSYIITLKYTMGEGGAEGLDYERKFECDNLIQVQNKLSQLYYKIEYSNDKIIAYEWMLWQSDDPPLVLSHFSVNVETKINKYCEECKQLLK